MDLFTIWYVLVDTAYQTIMAQTGRLRQRGPQPSFSDSEVVPVALIMETARQGQRLDIRHHDPASAPDPPVFDQFNVPAELLRRPRAKPPVVATIDPQRGNVRESVAPR